MSYQHACALRGLRARAGPFAAARDCFRRFLLSHAISLCGVPPRAASVAGTTSGAGPWSFVRAGGAVVGHRAACRGTRPRAAPSGAETATLGAGLAARCCLPSNGAVASASRRLLRRCTRQSSHQRSGASATCGTPCRSRHVFFQKPVPFGALFQVEGPGPCSSCRCRDTQ